MSTIFGILNRNMEPVWEPTLKRIHKQVCYWKPDTSSTWREANVGFGCAMLWNSPESRLERLPYIHDLGIKRYVITADARIDNRKMLIDLLNLGHLPPFRLTDASLILEAYLKWGENAPEYLLGDFVFAIWDKTEQKIFCARDHSGIKPFYFHISAKLFIFSNDMHGITSHPNVPLGYNDKAVSLFLSQITFHDPELTLFESIQKLPRATALTITSKEMKMRTYWNAEESPDIRLNSTDDYAEMLQELLKQSVVDRIRSGFPIASHLSGGLDSSTLAVLAKRYLSQQNKTLKTYGWVQPWQGNDNPDDFEWANALMISEAEGISHQFLEMDKDSLKASLWSDDLANNELTIMFYERIVVENAKKHGVRVMLSGWGGDELISYNARTHYLDMLYRGDIQQALSHIYHQSHSFKNFCGGIFRQLIRPALIGYPHIRKEHFQFAKESFCMEQGLKKNNLKRTHALLNQLDLLNLTHINTRTESWFVLGLDNKLEYRYPLLDKRIVSFALGIPPELYLYKGKSRYIFRKAINGILPDKIQWGHFKMETHRANYLMQLREEVIKDWICDIKKRLPSEMKNQYIDINKLLIYNKIHKNNNINTLFEQSAFIKSISILRMGHRFTNVGLKSIL